MGFLTGGQDEDTSPPPTTWQRISNFLLVNGNGVIGSIPLVALTIALLLNPNELKTKPEKTALYIYIMMLACLVFHPVKVPATAYIPIFMFPLFHVVDSNAITKSYFSANTVLLVVGGYIHQLLNISGCDKRFAHWLIFGSRDPFTVTSMGLVVKSSLAAYLLSLVSNRELVANYIMKLVVETMPSVGTANPTTGILANAIAISSTIGSMGIVIGARNVMFMRSMWEMSDHPDMFNFLDYFVFAFPVTVALFVLYLIYNTILVKIFVKDELDDKDLKKYETAVNNQVNAIPDSITVHEILTMMFTIVSLGLYFTRWSRTMKRITGSRGWADFKGSLDKTGNTNIPDVTVAAIMLVICCILPSTFHFAKIWTAETVGDLPPSKPDSAIVFWKIVDTNTNYGYMFLVGGFCALDFAVRKTDFAPSYLYKQLKFITKASLPMSVLMWCVIAGVTSNIMTSAGTSGMLTVLALNAYAPDNSLLKNKYQFVLATGMASGFGFFSHFNYTPMYTVKTIAKVPCGQRVIFNLLFFIMSILILWTAITFYAPLIFD